MDVAVKKYQMRRDERLKKRGLAVRMDADDDQNQNEENSGGKKKESHGNTRLPFGLCMRFGIEIGDDWTPFDAWEALRGKGITADGAYAKLKAGKDPAEPEWEVGEEEVDISKLVEGTKPSEEAPEEDVEKGEKIARESLMGDLSKTLKAVRNKMEGEKTAEAKGSDDEMVDTEGVTSASEEGTSEEELEKMAEEAFEEEAVEELTPKEPKKTFMMPSYYEGPEVEALPRGEKELWRSRGEDEWVLHLLRMEDGEKRGRIRRMTFRTVDDMVMWLKEKGVEEFVRPDTGEIINPMEKEFPEKIGEWRRSSSETPMALTALGIGLRDGRFVVTAKDMEGKTKKIEDYGSLRGAREGIKRATDVDMDKVKLSPAVKKEEERRTAWTKSDKVESIKEGDKEYGDLTVSKSWTGRWDVEGSTVDGEYKEWPFSTRAEAIGFLKDNGVEKARERGSSEEIDVQGYEPPKPIGKYSGRALQSLEIVKSPYGDEFWLNGRDLDGEKVSIMNRKMEAGGIEELKDKFASVTGLDKKYFEISDDTKAELDKAWEEAKAREQRKKEFKEKAVYLGMERYVDPHIVKVKDPYSKTEDYKVVGYDEDGKLRNVTYGRIDLFEIEDAAREWGIDVEDLIKDDEIKKDYEDFKKRKQEFEDKSVKIGDRKFSDVTIEMESGDYDIYGYDKRGRRTYIFTGESLEGMGSGVNVEELLKDPKVRVAEGAKREWEKEKKEKEGLASGEYWKPKGKERGAWKNLEIKPKSDGIWEIRGEDVDGKQSGIMIVDSWDEAVDYLEKGGAKDYKFVDKSGKEFGRPRDGMSMVSLVREPSGEYRVMARKKGGDTTEVFRSGSEDEARKWIRESNVPDSEVKTKGMNPNDDVVRVHPEAKTLKNFDKHRMERDVPMLNQLSEQEKKETAEMLTDLFNGGAFRLRAHDHFEEKFDDHFKNLLETGTSHGSSYKPGRRETGEKTFGHKNLSAEDCEKYGYFGLADDKEAYEDGTASGYGKTIFKFKKDALKDRVTYTFGDSLDSGRPLAGYAGDKPTIEGVSGLGMWGGGKHYLDDILKSYRKYKSGGITFKQFLTDIQSRCDGRYIELQYHGPLTMKDVESVVFPKYAAGSNWSIDKTFKNMTPKKRKQVLTFFRDNDIKFQYKDDDGLHDGFKYIEDNYELED